MVVVALDELHAPSRRVEPDEPRVARQPRLGEGDELGAGAGGRLDQGDGLVDAGVEVEEHRGCLHGGSAKLGMRDRHGDSEAGVVVAMLGRCGVPALSQRCTFLDPLTQAPAV
jgi:hypothetical protein